MQPTWLSAKRFHLCFFVFSRVFRHPNDHCRTQVSACLLHHAALSQSSRPPASPSQVGLNLSNNGVTDRGATLLSLCLQHNSTLCALVLDGNPAISPEAEHRIDRELETRSSMPEVSQPIDRSIHLGVMTVRVGPSLIYRVPCMAKPPGKESLQNTRVSSSLRWKL